MYRAQASHIRGAAGGFPPAPQVRTGFSAHRKTGFSLLEKPVFPTSGKTSFSRFSGKFRKNRKFQFFWNFPEVFGKLPVFVFRKLCRIFRQFPEKHRFCRRTPVLMHLLLDHGAPVLTYVSTLPPWSVQQLTQPTRKRAQINWAERAADITYSKNSVLFFSVQWVTSPCDPPACADQVSP